MTGGLVEPVEADMTRRTPFPILAALLVAGTFGLAAEKAVESAWTSVPVKVDGIAQDWDAQKPITDEGSQVDYALMNDAKNLYFIMVFRGPLAKTTLDYTGMRIYFTTGAKKSRDFGILFQKKTLTADALIANLQKKGASLSAEEMAEIRKKETHIVFTEEIIRPKKAAAETDPALATEPPVFRAAEAGHKVRVCEFRIPLSRVNQLGGIGAGPGQTVLLGFEWGGVNSQILKDMVAGRADRSVSAADRGSSSDQGWRDESGDGEGGFQSTPGRVPPSDYVRDPMFKKHSFWIEVKLAAKGS
jgi:hypothetical protein